MTATTFPGGAVDLSQYARKDTAQTFTEDQTIETDNALLIGLGGAITGRSTGLTARPYFSRNAVHNGTNWVRQLADTDSSLIEMDASGDFVFYTSSDAGNTVGSTITWSEKVRFSKAGVITAASSADLAAATASLRTLGTGALQAAAGNHTHSQLHDRLHSVTNTSDHTFPGGSTFLRADGTWQTPPDTTGAATLISTQTPSGVNAVTFSSIPQTYQHLQLVFSYAGSLSTNNTWCHVNGVTTSSYYWRKITASASAVSANGGSPNTNWDWGLVGNNIDGKAGSIFFPRYTSTNIKMMSGVMFQGNEASSTLEVHGCSINTTAITSITVTVTGTFDIARLSLYGLS